MNIDYPTIWPQFFTASIFQRKHLLMEDSFKDIIINSLQFLSKENRINLYAFCIMSNHIHLIWQPNPPYSLVQIKSSLMRHTAKAIISKLSAENKELLTF